MRISASRGLVAVATALVLSACQQGGATPAGRLPSSDHIHALRVGEDGLLLLGLHGALWSSDDGGTTWKKLGMEGQDAMAIGADPGVTGPLLVGGHGVLVRRREGSNTFQSLQPPELGSLDVHALAQAPSDPRMAYAFVVDGGFFASIDAGDTWELRARPGQQFGADITSLAVDRADPQIVLAAGARTGVVRSTDGARTFEPLSSVGMSALAYADSQRLFGITARGIEGSEDGGRTWSIVTARSDAALPGEPAALAADDPATIWLVTEDPRTLQRSNDGGRSWQEVARG